MGTGVRGLGAVALIKMFPVIIPVFPAARHPGVSQPKGSAWENHFLTMGLQGLSIHLFRANLVVMMPSYGGSVSCIAYIRGLRGGDDIETQAPTAGIFTRRSVHPHPLE